MISSVIRHAGASASSGFVRLLELESGEILRTWSMPESSHRADDPNPRGGHRGARGVSATDHRLAIANAERVMVFDSSWKSLGDLTHPLMGGVHDVLAEEDGVWACCTMADLLIKLDWKGNLKQVWEWREDAALVRELGLPKLPKVDRKVDHRDPNTARTAVRNTVHLNAIARCERGLLLSFGRILSAEKYRKQKRAAFIGKIASLLHLKRRDDTSIQVVRESSKGQQGDHQWAAVLLAEDGKATILAKAQRTNVPNHNIAIIDGTLIYNDTNGGRVVSVALGGAKPELAVPLPGPRSFARGYAELGGSRVLVGSHQPAAVYEVDLHGQRVTRTYSLAGSETEAVYGICLVPETFDEPPEELFGCAHREMNEEAGIAMR
ncbi:MAG TPA: hypothetical protein VIL86_10190 [Tepidisphaeraceae bacterium]